MKDNLPFHGDEDSHDEDSFVLYSWLNDQL